MPGATITVLLDEPPVGTIRPELYGHFIEHLASCIDGGIWVGEDSAIPNLGGFRTDVLDVLRQIRVPVVRWPGGCYADDYHWEDGVGPRKDRPRRVNVWWGENVESNGFGTHEFLAFCRYLGAQPYLAGNVGSGSPREMRDWVEYCNFAGDSTLARRRAANGSPRPFGVKYWGVGNESWGCGGNFCPEDYAREYKRFATYLRDFSGTELFLVAAGPDGNDADWTRRFFKTLGTPNPRWNVRLHGYAAHYYCGTAGPSATEFSVDEWYELLEKATWMENLVAEQRVLLDEFDPFPEPRAAFPSLAPRRRVGLIVDEWGTWHFPTPGAPPLWQQSALRDAVCAAITLDVFNRNAGKLVMANVAQLANVLQALVLTDGPRMLLTPTYHVFDLYQSHQGGQSLRVEFDAPPVKFAAPGGNRRARLPGLMGSASRWGNTLTLSVVNPHATFPAEASIVLRGGRARSAEGTVLTHEELSAHNTFDAPDVVRPAPAAVRHDESEWRHVFPPASVTVLKVRLG